jgi:hypothetical protein
MNAVPGQDCSWITAARPGLYVRTGRRTRRGSSCASLALLGARGARPDRDGQDHFCGPKYLCRPDALVLVGRLPRFDALGWPGCRLSLLETHSARPGTVRSIALLFSSDVRVPRAPRTVPGRRLRIWWSAARRRGGGGARPVCQGGVLGDRLVSTVTLRLGFRIVVGFGTVDRREGW